MSETTRTIRETLRGVELVFRTSPDVFSPRAVDAGTRAMLSVVEFRPGDRVLDLGCGYGPVGILAARLLGPERVVMLDSAAEAVSLAAENAERNGVAGVCTLCSDGFRGLDQAGFSLILCNPPYHVDFSVPKHFIEKGFNRLAPGGRFYLVTQREGWYRRKLTDIFGGVRTWRVGPYSVFQSDKRRADYANAIRRRERWKGALGRP